MFAPLLKVKAKWPSLKDRHGLKVNCSWTLLLLHVFQRCLREVCFCDCCWWVLGKVRGVKRASKDTRVHWCGWDEGKATVSSELSLAQIQKTEASQLAWINAAEFYSFHTNLFIKMKLFSLFHTLLWLWKGWGAFQCFYFFFCFLVSFPFYHLGM